MTNEADTSKQVYEASGITMLCSFAFNVMWLFCVSWHSSVNNMGHNFDVAMVLNFFFNVSIPCYFYNVTKRYYEFHYKSDDEFDEDY